MNVLSHGAKLGSNYRHPYMNGTEKHAMHGNITFNTRTQVGIPGFIFLIYGASEDSAGPDNSLRLHRVRTHCGDDKRFGASLLRCLASRKLPEPLRRSWTALLD